MGRRKKNQFKTPAANAHWIISQEIMINNRHVVPGTELSIWGERGRFKFVKHVVNGDKEWIDVIDKYKAFRAFKVEQVKRVHYKNKIRPPKKPVE